MRLSSASQLTVTVCIFALILSYATTKVSGASANFGNRRLLNLSGNAVEAFETPLDDLPLDLSVKPGNKVYQCLKGEGFQIYSYNETWKLVNASAVLSTFAGEEVGRHFFLPQKDADGGQPTWSWFSPPSSVTAKLEYNVTISPNSIPWLLLQATSNSGSSDYFGSVTYVQRLFTESGLPPVSSAKANIGDIYESPYSATYFLYTKQ